MSTHIEPEWNRDPQDNKPIILAAALTTMAVVIGGGAFVYATMANDDNEQTMAQAEPAGDSSDALAELEPIAEPEPVLEPDPMQLATEAQARVESLQAELDEANARIAEFEAEEARQGERSIAARERWQAMEAEVARLQVALADAVAERDALRTELASTLEKLDEQIAATARVTKERDIWKRASTDNLWAAFVQSTKVKLCDKGTRKSLSNCHEAVAMVFDDEARSRFDHCVAARQSIPILVEVDRRSTPPAFSEPFPNGARQIGKDWHVVYCDPTLPEATMLSENELPEPTVLQLASR